MSLFADKDNTNFSEKRLPETVFLVYFDSGSSKKQRFLA